MTTNSTTTLPLVLSPKRLDSMEIPFLKLKQDLNAVVDKSDHNKIIQRATSGLDQLLLQQKLIFLDTRAYAYSKQHQSDLALADAHRMIGCAPMHAAGYLRKANIFEMYGKTKYAIEAYDEGLQNTGPGEDQRIYVQQLETRRELAVECNEMKIDFLDSLPIDIIQQVILPHFSLSTKAMCLTVSKIWRKKILECSSAWKHLTVNDSDKEATQITDVIPSIGCHVQHLTIENTNKSSGIDTAYFTHMQNGHLNEIKSFKIKVTCGNQHIQQGPYVTSMTISFWQIRKTLTTLDLDFGDRTYMLSLAGIIFLCVNLSKLSYTTTLPLVKLDRNFLATEHHDALIDLDITASMITGADIKPMLIQCHNLRRLLISTCDTSVFNVINNYAPHLEIFAYNADYTIPELQTTINAGEEEKKGGLKSLYCTNGRMFVSTRDILPIIYKNQSTLETFRAALTPVNAAELRELYTKYPVFKLESISSMALWCSSGMQQFLLSLIQGSTSLTELEGVSIHDIDNFVDVIMTLPAVTKFTMSHTNGTIIGHPSLIRLFKKYAASSHESYRSTICLRYCSVVSDDQIAILPTIKTLKELTLCSLISVSTNGINAMIENLQHHEKLTNLELAEMDSVHDSTLTALGKLKKLSYLYLKSLKLVTDQGIRGLLNNKDTFVLDYLVVNNCPQVTQDCISLAKKKINTVKYSN